MMMTMAVVTSVTKIYFKNIVEFVNHTAFVTVI